MLLFSSTRAFIYFLEILAQILPILLSPSKVTGDVLCFIDNEASKHALIKGYGNIEAINNLIGMYWTGCTADNINPWFERVSTHANISDAVSRGDFREAEQRGWTRLHVELRPLWPILRRVATDSIYAITEAFYDIRKCFATA